MRRREFLVVTARMGAAAAFQTVYPLHALPLPDAADAVFDAGGDVVTGFPVDVRVLDPKGPLTDWFTVTNDTRELIIRRIRPCLISAVEYRMEALGEPWCITHKLGTTTEVTDDQPVILSWGDHGLVEFY